MESHSAPGTAARGGRPAWRAVRPLLATKGRRIASGTGTRPARVRTSGRIAWWRRTVWRVRSHRAEALVFGGGVAAVAFVFGVAGWSRWLGATASRHGAVGDVIAGLAVAWVPLMVIDMRRCTRERSLRHKVESELIRVSATSRLQEQELDGCRDRVLRMLASGGPTIVYQPIVEMSSRRPVGYEALSRFGDGTPPDQWFAMADRVGLGLDLELAAVKNATASTALLPADSFLSVNVSADVLFDPRLHHVVSDDQAGRIVFEITEHVPLDDYERIRPAVAALRERGLRIAVDDAGSGYAGLRHIVDLHPDIIKLDGCLVRGLHEDIGRRSLIAALLAFSADLGVMLVAECVEEEAEAAMLQNWGVHFGQGWLFGKPAPLPALAEHLGHSFKVGEEEPRNA